MAHHQSQSQNGLDSTTPPIGMFTGLLGFAAFLGAVWVTVKAPGLALKCAGAAFCVAVFSGGASIIANPLLFWLLAIFGGILAITHRK
jgi:hypothetical protein